MQVEKKGQYGKTYILVIDGVKYSKNFEKEQMITVKEEVEKFEKTLSSKSSTSTKEQAFNKLISLFTAKKEAIKVEKKQEKKKQSVEKENKEKEVNLIKNEPSKKKEKTNLIKKVINKKETKEEIKEEVKEEIDVLREKNKEQKEEIKNLKQQLLNNKTASKVVKNNSAKPVIQSTRSGNEY